MTGFTLHRSTSITSCPSESDREEDNEDMKTAEETGQNTHTLLQRRTSVVLYTATYEYNNLTVTQNFPHFQFFFGFCFLEYNIQMRMHTDSSDLADFLIQICPPKYGSVGPNQDYYSKMKHSQKKQYTMLQGHRKCKLHKPCLRCSIHVIYTCLCPHKPYIPVHTQIHASQHFLTLM